MAKKQNSVSGLFLGYTARLILVTLISGHNSSLGQRLVRIISPKTVESQRRLSEFHDKLLSAMETTLFDMQVTAYTDKATIPASLVEIDLTKRLVYLIAPLG